MNLRIIILSSGLLFGLGITIFLISPVLNLENKKSINNRLCPFCKNKIPKDIEKCHICGKEIK